MGKRQRQLDENLFVIMMSDDNWSTIHKTLCFQINHFDCMHRRTVSRSSGQIFGLLFSKYKMIFLCNMLLCIAVNIYCCYTSTLTTLKYIRFISIVLSLEEIY